MSYVSLPCSCLLSKLYQTQTWLPFGSDFSYVPYGLSQTTTNETYQRQIFLNTDFLVYTAVVQIHDISKGGMKEKAEERLNKIPGIKSIEETHFTARNGKWLLLTSKKDKEKLKREVERILNGLTHNDSRTKPN